MAKFNFKAADSEPKPERKVLKPGVYVVEVATATEEPSSSGEGMISLRLKDVVSGWTVCFDRLMLTGRGIGITSAKLRALGIDGQDERMFEADELVGRRARISTKEHTYKGKKGLQVDVYAEEPFRCGYMKTVDPYNGPESLVPLDDTPF